MLEAFLTILDGRQAEETVWTADVSYWITGQKHAGLAPPAWDTEAGYLELHSELGCMPYYWYADFWLGRPVYDGVEESMDSRGDRTIREWRTPVGTLRQESLFSRDSVSEAITKYAVETEDDLKVLLHVLEHRRLEPACLGDYRRRMELWAEYDGFPGIALPRSPLPCFFVEWAGVQNGVFLMADRPQLVRQVFDLMQAQEESILDATCEHAPPLVHFADNLTGETFAGFFEEHMAERYRHRLGRLHEAGIRSAVHLDGTVDGLLGKLAAVGFDAVEALTPAPVGDVSVEDMRALAGSDTLILWGGIPGAMFAPPYTWKQMRAHVEKLLEAWGAAPFVVGVGDQVPPNGDISMCRKISDMLG